MKIVCESCAAKYSIADEKVAGRVFKIRCKKCGAAIVVRGDQGASEAPPAAAAGFDYGGEAVWHAVVDGEQQGPFAPSQLGSMISAPILKFGNPSLVFQPKPLSKVTLVAWASLAKFSR